MTRCDACQLVMRSDGVAPASEHGQDLGHGRPAVTPESYALDADSERTVRGMLARNGTSPASPERGRDLAQGRRRVLAVVDGVDPHARLVADPRLEVTYVTSAELLAHAPAGPFDAAFVNGAIEHTGPLPLLQRVRGALRPGGDLVVLVGAGLISPGPAAAGEATREPRLPRYAFSAVPLTRVTLAAGFRPHACGILSRSMDVPARDERLVGEEVPLAGAARLLEAAGRRVEVSSGLLAMHAHARPPSSHPPRPKLSIIMPVFNEAKTFNETFERVYAAQVAGVDREIVIVESNSTDGSRELVQAVEKRPGVVAVYEDRPQGKGHAVRAAIARSTGDFVLIQDADSEYDVDDYDIVLEPLLALSATFVLGSRHMGGRTWKIRQFADQRLLAYVMNLAHESFTALANGLYGTEMRDPTTMYKAFRRDAYEGIRFTRNRFDYDWELVLKLVRRGHVPIEVPVNYRSRSFAEGKKVRFFQDPVTWLETIVASRFEPLCQEDG
jgi:SAM-dependent methyltransferase